MTAKDFWVLIKTAAAEWVEDDAQRLGAALAYYSVLSLGPLLIIALKIAAAVFGRQAAHQELLQQIESLVGEQGATATETMIQNAQNLPSGVLPTIFAVAVLLIASTTIFGSLQGALNTIWEVQAKPGRGIRGILRDRFLSFLMVLASGLLLLLLVVVSGALAVTKKFLGDVLPEFIHFSQVADFVISLIVTTLVFASIYKALPDVTMAWRDVWIGAGTTAVLFTVGKFLIAFYLSHSNLASAYGAAGSFVVLLVWTYYSAQVFLFGAEVTQVYAKTFGSGMAPKQNAVAVTESSRAQQGMARRDQVHQLATQNER